MRITGNWALALVLIQPVRCLAAMPVVHIENAAGNITIRIETRERVGVVSDAHGGSKPPEDARVRERADEVSIIAPSANGRVDLEVQAPYGWEIIAEAADGSIDFAGLSPQVTLVARSGGIRVSAPWEITVATIQTEAKPRVFTHPALPAVWDRKNAAGWSWRGQVSWAAPCCEIRIAGAPNRIDLVDIPVPPDSPVKPPSIASSLLDGILEGGGLRRKPAVRGGATTISDATRRSEIGDAPRFAADVRLVSLSIAAYDRDGHPVTGLEPQDFEIMEDGVGQEVALVRTGETAVNLALLLDLSRTTTNGRDAMEKTARRFGSVVRPQDRLSVYGLVGYLFYVYSSPTVARPFLPALGGTWAWATPLYEGIVLGCAEELLSHPDERNALIIVTDGLNSSGMDPRTRYPLVAFERLREAAQEMPILIYPVLMESRLARSGPEPTPRQKMEALAGASGGRVFDAEGDDLSSAAARVAEDLRSVYTVAYYPKNQTFDGKWRPIHVRIKRPGVAFRTRRGYYAR